MKLPTNVKNIVFFVPESQEDSNVLRLWLLRVREPLFVDIDDAASALLLQLLPMGVTTNGE